MSDIVISQSGPFVSLVSLSLARVTRVSVARPVADSDAPPPPHEPAQLQHSHMAGGIMPLARERGCSLSAPRSRTPPHAHSAWPT